MAVNGFNSKILTLYFFKPVNVRREKKNGTIKKNTIIIKAFTKAGLR